mgnify:CR=1 FL=1
MARQLLTVRALVLGLSSATYGADDISFSYDVLPILSDKCFHCHGPDASHREAELRLDERDSALFVRDGRAAIVPGDPDKSELLRRVTSSNDDELMPPPKSHRKRLTPKEVEVLKKWIAAGAKWGRHWAFEKPERKVPADLKENLVDYFIAKRLAAEGLAFSKPAAKHTLLRRLSFDVTGLPPTESELKAFLEGDAGSYVAAVDRLLKSPHYGERMAMWWLDAARYSDTDGFQGDATRTNWPWRDWVIESFNKNMPFDQFTIEQFAGDLLPDAKPEQILATCFHRNHMTNGEGGRDPEESRIDYVLDRVNTTGTVWLGLTLGCCQCHSHKFDPVSQTDYYRMNAFFNSIDEDGGAGPGAKPLLSYQSPYAARAVEEAQRIVDERKPIEAAARKVAEEQFPKWLDQQIAIIKSRGFRAWRPLLASSLTSVEGTSLTQDADGIVQTSGPNPRQDDYRLIAPLPTSSTSGSSVSREEERQRVTGLRLEVFPHESHSEGKLSRGKSGEFILTDVKLQIRKRGQSQIKDVLIAAAVADVENDAKARQYGKVADTLDDDPRNGWTTSGHDATKPHVAVFALAEPLQLANDEELVFVLLHRSTIGDANIGRFRVSITDQPGDAVRKLDKMPFEELAEHVSASDQSIDGKLQKRLLAQFLSDHAEYQQAKELLDRANKQFSDVKGAAGKLNVMVLGQKKELRKTHVLERGVWNKKGDEVATGVIPSVLQMPDDQVQSRLDLAKWLVARDNPLTARVIVNHLWQMFFGAGLVRTPDDFGLQGERPTHPELLDALAVELMEHQWDLQHVIRLIVSSRTYQQSSDATDELLARDPDNRWLARASRFRLPSWMLRDAALQTSGLLNESLGGPPVRPYQPPGVWEELFMGRYRYEPSEGATQHRRTVYAFWRRSSAPTFLFDSAQRRVCEVRMSRTNTPLHALTMLNDGTILEASRKLAEDTVAVPGDLAARLKSLHRRVLSRDPHDRELAVLTREWNRAAEHFRNKPGDALKLVAVGQPTLDSDQRRKQQSPEFAAHLLTASMLLNLDEALTHE